MSISEDQMALAAEYVLGTLDAEEQARAERLIASDPEFANLVRDWERRLGELNVMVGSVEPPADTFDKIKARIAAVVQPTAIHLPDPAEAPSLPRLGAAPQLEVAQPPPAAAAGSGIGAAARPPERRAEIAALTRRLRRSRHVAGALAALAAAVCAVFVASLVRPDLLPGPLRSSLRVGEPARTAEREGTQPAGPPSRFVAVMQRDSVSPAFILTVDLNSRTMTVRRVAADTPPDKSYELWLVSSRFPQPRSLGLVGDREFTSAQLASYEPGTISNAFYAISLEPSGGSPTGAPTGPVLWTGKLIEALPPDAAP